MSCIVVSDVHLGSESCNYKQFCDFLVWIRSLDGRKETIKCEDKELVITYPEKFVLLGDILELWDPIDGDRDNVVKQSIRPFSLLSDIKCEKIYVIGNSNNWYIHGTGLFGNKSSDSGRRSKKRGKLWHYGMAVSGINVAIHDDGFCSCLHVDYRVDKWINHLFDSRCSNCHYLQKAINF